MAITAEKRKMLGDYLSSSTKFHGEFKYPEECYPFADLATQETIELEEDGYPFKIYVFTAKNRAANCPVHINIHGGGFVCRHQINDSLWSAWLADQLQGVVVDVDYTLSDVAPWPVCLDQCRKVARYVYANCEAMDLDPKRISIGGYSAGGVLAVACAMAAVVNHECPYCMIIDGYGPTDMTIPADFRFEGEYWKTPEGRNVAFSELLFEGDFDRCKDPMFSPLFAEDEILKQLPHTVICAGGACPFRFQDQELGMRLASLGVEVSMKTFPGAAHGFIVHFMDGWKEAAEMIVRNLKSASL